MNINYVSPQSDPVSASNETCGFVFLPGLNYTYE